MKPSSRPFLSLWSPIHRFCLATFGFKGPVCSAFQWYPLQGIKGTSVHHITLHYTTECSSAELYTAVWLPCYQAKISRPLHPVWPMSGNERSCLDITLHSWWSLNSKVRVKPWTSVVRFYKQIPGHPTREVIIQKLNVLLVTTNACIQ